RALNAFNRDALETGSLRSGWVKETESSAHAVHDQRQGFLYLCLLALRAALFASTPRLFGRREGSELKRSLGTVALHELCRADRVFAKHRLESGDGNIDG